MRYSTVYVKTMVYCGHWWFHTKWQPGICGQNSLNVFLSSPGVADAIVYSQCLHHGTHCRMVLRIQIILASYILMLYTHLCSVLTINGSSINTSTQISRISVPSHRWALYFPHCWLYNMQKNADTKILMTTRSQAMGRHQKGSPDGPEGTGLGGFNCTSSHTSWLKINIDGLMQDCRIFSALAMEILQSCIKPSIWPSLCG